jgi:ubiquinone/menaquinone biosynthesis C-methylase UbiE
MSVIKNSLNESHEYVKMAVRDCDIVIDATCGNGNDTLFLANLVGENGLVYSFDVQEEAIKITVEKLKKYDKDSRVRFICDGHQHMEKYVDGNVSAVMFNLGYRPGGDHSIATCFLTTKVALESAMKLLKKNGIITVVVYYGKDSGFDEKNCLLEYIKTINPKEFIVFQREFVNQINCPPILICIEKI